MKTKEQIENFLKNKKYSSEMDYLMISSYCQNTHRLKLHKPTAYHENDENTITCTDFISWIEHGYGAGDVVKWDKNIGLVQNSTLNSLQICLKINSEGATIDSITVPVQSVSLAGDNAVQSVKMALSKNNLEFGNPYFTITDKFIPQSGNLVMFTDLRNGKNGYGVSRITKPNGEVYMFCYFYKGEEIHYGMNEYLGDVTDFQFTCFGAADYPRKLLDQELHTVGKTWNHYLKRVEPIHMQCNNGETYYYITDKMIVASDTERGKPTSHKRYLAGNYFKNEVDALEILAAEMEIRRKYMARPGI